MKKFQKSDNKDLQKASTGLLWELGLIEIETNIQQAQPLDPPPSYEESINHRHIMISYSWADQEQVKLIRDKLEMQGYKVWMDIGNISKYTTSSPTHMTRKRTLTASSYIADNGFTCMGGGPSHVYINMRDQLLVFKIDFHCFD